jgi:hypothetical protein
MYLIAFASNICAVGAGVPMKNSRNHVNLIGLGRNFSLGLLIMFICPPKVTLLANVTIHVGTITVG